MSEKKFPNSIFNFFFLQIRKKPKNKNSPKKKKYFKPNNDPFITNFFLKMLPRTFFTKLIFLHIKYYLQQ